MDYRIWHNARCRKSRAGLDYLKTKTDKFEVKEYLKTGVKQDELIKLLQKLNFPASEIVRTQEKEYKDSLRGRKFEEAEWVKILCDNPKLIRRPIIESRYKAVIGDPPEDLDILF